jgi:predicted transcriptional regulator of viral defense system
MGHLNIPYYIGWLSSAALLGASHHAPQVFQVATSRHVRERTVGRSKMQFIIREHVSDLPVTLRQTRSGTARVASRATTLLDVVSNPLICGGLDNATTIIIELCETDEAFIPELLTAAKFYPSATIKRLGWIMEGFASVEGVEALQELAWAGAISPSKLDPTGSFSGNLDKRWNLYINRRIEPDA